jgi:nitrous oxide reductase accessory protein NosL
MKLILAGLLGIGLLALPRLEGAEKKPVKPGAKDKCPVCGMFVYKYPDFLAEILFKDGSVAFFDGAKDLFKYYFDLQKYDRKHTSADFDCLYVTDYYSLELIDGRQAYYVVGSDVYGPMGKELIPFADESQAKVFMKDHQGKRLLRFKEISSAQVKELG